MVDQFGRWYPDFPGQQPYQDPAYIRASSMMSGNSQQTAQQAMTPPTIHADIIMVESFDEMDRFPLSAGANQMFATKDEEHFAIRSMFANGEHSDVFYDKRPPAPPAPKINPADYVRKDEIATIFSELLNNQRTTSRKAVKSEEAE